MQAGSALTDAFHPGKEIRFRIMQHLITNFHLPRSTLLVLVSQERTIHWPLTICGSRALYRFFSYGDAMLIDPARSETSSH